MSNINSQRGTLTNPLSLSELSVQDMPVSTTYDSPDEAVSSRFMREYLEQFLEDLPRSGKEELKSLERQEAIIRSRYGFVRKMTYRELGKYFGITPKRVEELENKAKIKLMRDRVIQQFEKDYFPAEKQKTQ
jgi:DNA-directed RNA polymerase sigma subunit (sigma70/sigma32)